MAAYTPSAQLKLTNVAYVRLQKKGKRFEIACYRNKVLSWRNKMETDITEVLQIDTVFINVSKGLLANSKDLQEAFGKTSQHIREHTFSDFRLVSDTLIKLNPSITLDKICGFINPRFLPHSCWYY